VNMFKEILECMDYRNRISEITLDELCKKNNWDKKSASDFLAVHQIFNEVTAGSEKTKRINRDWIDASFRKYKVEKTEEMLDKVYDKILENGYNVV
jgi:hypothetical protein